MVDSAAMSVSSRTPRAASWFWMELSTFADAKSKRDCSAPTSARTGRYDVNRIVDNITSSGCCFSRQYVQLKTRIQSTRSNVTDTYLQGILRSCTNLEVQLSVTITYTEGALQCFFKRCCLSVSVKLDSDTASVESQHTVANPARSPAR